MQSRLMLLASLAGILTASCSVDLGPVSQQPESTSSQSATNASGTSMPSQASWMQVGKFQQLQAIAFTSATQGWVLDLGDNSAGGVIETTSNGGGSFQRQFTGPNKLDSIAIRGQVGLCGGDGGTLLRTADAGQHWTLVDWSGAGKGTIAAIAFLSDSSVLMISDTSQDVGELFKSTDGGNTWADTGASTSSDYLFADQGNVFVGSEHYDGVTLAPSKGLDSDISSVAFPNPNSPSTGWATTRRGLYTTSDGGKNWTAVSALNLGNAFWPPADPYYISFSSPNDGILICEDSGQDAVTTSDGGKTWTKVMSGSYERYLLNTGVGDFKLLDSEHGWGNGVHTLVRYSP